MTMAKFKVIDKDRGWKKIAAELRKAATKPYVKVGFIGDSGGAEHKDSTLTVAGVAAIHEYGAPDHNIPERSFIRGTIEAHSTEVQGFIDHQNKSVLLQKINVKEALGRLGLFMVALIKNRIVKEHVPPPLKESTIKAKTRDGKTGEVPLVDTGQMLNSIRHQVVLEGGSE